MVMSVTWSQPNERAGEVVPEERKLVTVLFADVTGSTALGEDLDPEDVRALMGRYYEHARQIVSDHGGTLEKFIGDAVMAVFGLPQAQGNDAERAVAAALALQQAVGHDSVLSAMTLRIGVNTGEVVATSDASSGDFLVTGDAVNVAARLQQGAHPGEILTSERTHAATQAAFLFGEGREVEVKGKREPLRVSPVVGVRPTRQVERPPLVGRKRELAHLSLLQSWALDEHRPQLVSIIAPAGTGKTRLLEEFVAQLDPAEGWRVATGRCFPYGQVLTYWPLRGLLEDLVGEIEWDRVLAALARGGQSREDAARLADLVLAPLGIESEGLTERESIFGAWRLLIETLAKEAPRLVVFEDLHWASESLLDLVEHIMHPRTQAPLLLIAISRPELLDRRPMWGGGGRENLTALVLGPLSEGQTADLVEHLGGTLPASIRQRIIERCGGNPFFATELVRGLAERGIGRDAQDVVPDTVQAAVLARLDALPPRERRVVQAAAVAGRAFRPATLATILGDLDSAETNTALDGLVARDLAVPGEGDAYTFRHVLIRDVAYGTLSRAERIRMHAAVAAWLEEDAGNHLDEFVELIAYHYREAVLLARRSTVSLPLPFAPGKAVSLLERAGELASSGGAYAEAQGHLRNAIEISQPEERLRLYEKLGDYVAFGDWSTGAYRQALELWRAARELEPLAGARLLRKMLMIHMRWQGSVADRPGEQEMVEMRAEARRLAEAAGDEDELWRLKVTDLYWPWWRGAITTEEVEDGRRIGQAAAAYFEERQEWDMFHAALDGYSSIAQTAGDHREVVAAASRRLTAPTGNRLDRGDAVSALVWGHLDSGEYDQSVEVMTRALTELRPEEPRVVLSNGVSFAVLAACLGGRWNDLEPLVGALEQSWEEMRRDVGAGFLLAGFFAALHVALARQDRAAIDAASSVVERLLSPQSRADRRPLLAAYVADDPARLTLDLEHGFWDWGATNPIVASGYMFLNERGVVLPPHLLDRLVSRERARNIAPIVHALQVHQALAGKDPTELVQAIDQVEASGLVPHAARMRIVLAQMTGDPAQLEQARPVLERLEDRQFLRRLEEVAASLR
jgi:class 3 adenylate cyclase/tetratricopeptide (TPR) repeat protein